MIFYDSDMAFYDSKNFWENLSHIIREILHALGHFHLRFLFLKTTRRTVYKCSIYGRLFLTDRKMNYVIYNTELSLVKINKWIETIKTGKINYRKFIVEKIQRSLDQKIFVIPRNKFCDFLLKHFCYLLFLKRYELEEDV